MTDRGTPFHRPDDQHERRVRANGDTVLLTIGNGSDVVTDSLSMRDAEAMAHCLLEAVRCARDNSFELKTPMMNADPDAAKLKDYSGEGFPDPRNRCGECQQATDTLASERDAAETEIAHLRERLIEEERAGDEWRDECHRLRGRLEMHRTCPACGWDKSTEPRSGEEPPICKGALDAQEAAEKRAGDAIDALRFVDKEISQLQSLLRMWARTLR